MSTVGVPTTPQGSGCSHRTAPLADRASRTIDKPAVDAKLDLAGGNVSPQPSRNGVAVRAAWLRSRVRDTLLSTAPTRDVVHIKTRVVRPQVTTEQLAAKYPAVLVLNRSAFTLTLYKHLQRAKSYQVAVGMVGLDG